MTERVILGRFGSAYGVRGWVHIISFTTPLDNILRHPEWLVKHKGQWQTLTLEQGKAHGKGIVAKIQGINDRELVREYTNDSIAVLREALPELDENEFYWQDLIGCTVSTESGISLGTVKDLIETGSNDVFVVAGERERLIPYLDSVVTRIDLSKKEIIVNWDPEF